MRRPLNNHVPLKLNASTQNNPDMYAIISKFPSNPLVSSKFLSVLEGFGVSQGISTHIFSVGVIFQGYTLSQTHCLVVMMNERVLLSAVKQLDIAVNTHQSKFPC